MVEWAKFKPEVSGSLLVSLSEIWLCLCDSSFPQVLVVCLMLAIVSISFPYWLTKVILTRQTTRILNFHVQGRVEMIDGGEEGEAVLLTTVSFGLFEGRKTRTRGGTCTRTVKCMTNV